MKRFLLVLSIRLLTPKIFRRIRNGTSKPSAEHVQVVSLSGRRARHYQDKLFLFCVVFFFFLRDFGSSALMVESLYGQNNGFMLTTSGCISIGQTQRKHFNSASLGVVVFIFFFFSEKRKASQLLLVGNKRCWFWRRKKRVTALLPPPLHK